MKRQAGFTLIELLLAAAFFAFILMFATAAFIQVNRSYNKGITVKRVHESTRQIVQDIARTIQSAPLNVSGGSVQVSGSGGLGPNYVCVSDEVRYIWNELDLDPASPNPGKQDFYLLKDTTFANCDEAVGPGGDEIDMLDDRLAVVNLEVNPVGTTLAYEISLSVSVYEAPSGGFLDDIADTQGTAACNIVNGDQFCDVASLTTVVTLRY